MEHRTLDKHVSVFVHLSWANTTKSSMASYARYKQARVVQLQHFIQLIYHYHVTFVGFSNVVRCDDMGAKR